MRLEVGAGQCGWRREGGRVVLNLYVQQDALVQQVVDEEVMVECDMESREGRIVRVEDVEEVIEIQVESVQSFGVGHSWVSVEEEELLEDIVLDKIRDNGVEMYLINEDHGSEMGWQDFKEVTYDGEDAISEHVNDGDHEDQVKQMNKMNTKERGKPVENIENAHIVDDIKSQNILEKTHREDELCLSSTRIILAFGVLLVILVLALLFSCVLWMKARGSMLSSHHHYQHHPHQRGAYVVHARDQRCIL